VVSLDFHFSRAVTVRGVSSLSWLSNIEKIRSVSTSILVVGVIGAPTNFSSSRSSSTGAPGAGSRDNKSGASFCIPGTCIVLKSKLASCSDQCVHFKFLSLALYNQVSAEFSVKSSKRRVSRYGRNLSVAQITARHSRSTAAYLVCVSLNFLLASPVTRGIPGSAYGIPFENPQTLPTKSEFPLFQIICWDSRNGINRESFPSNAISPRECLRNSLWESPLTLPSLNFRSFKLYLLRLQKRN